LWALNLAGLLLPITGSPSAYFLGAFSAALYAGAVALGVGAFAHNGERMRNAGEARYRMLAQNTTDLITRHARNGSVIFVSHAAQRLAGVPASSLTGDGLFERVHVADRPAFLSALADAA